MAITECLINGTLRMEMNTCIDIKLSFIQPDSDALRHLAVLLHQENPCIGITQLVTHNVNDIGAEMLLIGVDTCFGDTLQDGFEVFDAVETATGCILDVTA